MPALTRNRPIEQTSPDLAVSNRLPLGKHRFELVVIDDAGQASKPRQVVVEVIRAGVDLNLNNNLRDGLINRRRIRDPLRDRIVPPIRR